MFISLIVDHEEKPWGILPQTHVHKTVIYPWKVVVSYGMSTVKGQMTRGSNMSDEVKGNTFDVEAV